MKIEWRKEINFQVEQFAAMFDGLGSDIALTLAMLSVTVVPLIGVMFLVDLIIRSI